MSSDAEEDDLPYDDRRDHRVPDAEKRTLQFTIHWKGGVHTHVEMQRPRSATDTATPMEALEIIRRMAVRHGDDQIASVLNRSVFHGKGNAGIRTECHRSGTIQLQVRRA